MLYIFPYEAGLKPPPSLSPCSPSSSCPSTTSHSSASSGTNSTTPSCSSSISQDHPLGKEPSIYSTTRIKSEPNPLLHPVTPSDSFNTGLETGADIPSNPHFNDPWNPYSVTRPPSQLMFVMPSLGGGLCNQLMFDSNSCAEPMLSSHFFGSRQFSPPETSQPTPPTAPQSYQHRPHPSLPHNYPNPQAPVDTRTLAPSWDLYTSTVTPSATSSSRQPSELIHEYCHHSPSSPCDASTSRASPICSKFGSRHPSPANPYSRSGFDLMGALAQVVSRPNAQIRVGAVDASAALVVVDARQDDLPIIFASPSFSLLTGYETSEIIGQNCRFLQKQSNSALIKGNPPTQVAGPSPIRQIRSHIEARREIQSSIINYRKDGQAFMNLVTVIPIAWNSSEISHFVGFQADIYSLTYSLGIPVGPKEKSPLLQAYQLNAPKAITIAASRKSSLLSPKPQKVSSPLPAVLAESRSHLEHFITSHSYYETVLNECRDLVLAITLKGTLCYVSSSCEHILGYQEEMLLNQNISMICHPGDLIGILRQLKLIGNTSHTPIDLVFRAINKQGGSFWMELQGQLHVEVGKGRKYLVVVGRRREVGPISWRAIRSVGGLDAKQFWMKLSLDALCLFATRPVREILSFEPGDMVGKSLIQLSSPSERVAIINAIRSAHEGCDVITLAYSLKDRTGVPIQVVGNFYPPHYSSGPQACGMSLPSSKLGNPPPMIFCQTSLLNPAQHRCDENKSEKPSFPLWAQSFSNDPIVPSVEVDSLNKPPCCSSSSREILGDHPPISCLTSNSANFNSDDDLFGRLGTTKTTPWNREFSQLKQQNMKLRSILSLKSLSSGKSRSNVSTRPKNIHSISKSSGSPY